MKVFIDSREPVTACPKLQSLIVLFIAGCKSVGIDPLIYLVYRSSDSQNKLYDQGRSQPGKIVTHAKGGQSPHNKTQGGRPASEAFDCVPLVHGKCMWSDEESYKIMAAIGTKLGLEWGGDFKSIHDSPHFQLPQVTKHS